MAIDPIPAVPPHTTQYHFTRKLSPFEIVHKIPQSYSVAGKTLTGHEIIFATEPYFYTYHFQKKVRDIILYVHYSRRMNVNHAVIAFSALSQETRLRVFKLLIEYGNEGTPAGNISEQLGTPHNTLSFHLMHLRHAGLVTSRRQGRSVIYAANCDAIEVLINYLKENCCVRETRGNKCKLGKGKKI